MAVSQPEKYWLPDDLELLPDDGNRYEVIDGELLVTPPPGVVHQRIVLQLAILLEPYARSVGLELRIAPSAVRFSDTRDVQPDLLALPPQPDGRFSQESPHRGRVVLTVEAWSPSTARNDRTRKLITYRDAGVDEYWIVDTPARTVERWRPTSVAPDLLRQTLSWQPTPDRDPLLIDLVALFARVHDQ